MVFKYFTTFAYSSTGCI